jgi:hypothetical protein
MGLKMPDETVEPLKPCPFCGGFRVVVVFGIARCQDCWVKMDRGHNDDALLAWNRRAIDTDALRRVAEDVERIVWAFPLGDSRRDHVRKLSATILAAIGDKP